MGAGSVTTAKKRQKKRPQLRPKKCIGKSKIKEKKKKSSDNNTKSNIKKNGPEKTVVKLKSEITVIERPTVSQQLSFFIDQYQSANAVQLSSLELDSLKETCMVEQGPDPAQNNTGNLVEHLKVAFGSSWKEVLCEKHHQEGKVDPGSPALLVISSSALRSLELLRELRSLTADCHAAKLFSKHMKIEEQVSILKNRVNIASGTPSRIKKLVDMEALGLSRVAVIGTCTQMSRAIPCSLFRKSEMSSGTCIEATSINHCSKENSGYVCLVQYLRIQGERRESLRMPNYSHVSA